MKKLILALAFTSSLCQMAVAQEIQTTFDDTDLAEIQDNVCYTSHQNPSDETALDDVLAVNTSGQYTYTTTESVWVSGGDDDDDDDDDDGGGYYQTRTVTVPIDATKVDPTIKNNVSNPSVQEEVSNICI